VRWRARMTPWGEGAVTAVVSRRGKARGQIAEGQLINLVKARQRVGPHAPKYITNS